MQGSKGLGFRGLGFRGLGFRGLGLWGFRGLGFALCLERHCTIKPFQGLRTGSGIETCGLKF